MDRSSPGASAMGSPHGSASASCAALRSDSSVGTAVLTKDDAVSPKPVSLRPALTRRAAVVAGSAAAAAAAPAAARRSAMQKALGKVGSPYRYGAAGPNAFDCSGLVTWAFKSSGKSLPRTSSQLSRVGAPVSKSALQPGDLVFFYKPVSHVGIYIGNGKVVHASNRKSPVKVSDIGRMPFNSARRV